MAARRSECDPITQAAVTDVAGVSPVTGRSTVEGIRAIDAGDPNADSDGDEPEGAGGNEA